ncbi:MAG: tRNA preQ1(34) S-adenosylmethionine ribosyltransferase-isomerase QueA, partial [Dehalococcoidales bacterium]|nr:tRNA preQ1(34) S-adenosylmethionine ribosyltransferase-isomerase QueA [Dehalococcoidales bacterium]
RRLRDGTRIEFAKDFKSPRYAQSGLDAGPLYSPVTADHSPLSLSQRERARVRVQQSEQLTLPEREGITPLHVGESISLVGEILERTAAGARLIAFDSAANVEKTLEELGVVPLPPYVHAPLGDPERYQTIYARTKGSVAAPTAGLHFTPELVARLEAMGVEFAFVTLHIGLDTFRPVQAEHISEHKMHSEFCELSEEVSSKLNAARRQGRRIISVGTTSVRVLESAAQSAASKGSPDVVVPFSGWTDIFIYPGYAFRAVDALITNFHLPRSTLMMLVSAFAGKELIDRAYDEAIAGDYRFYSFGDAMFISWRSVPACDPSSPRPGWRPPARRRA